MIDATAILVNYRCDRHTLECVRHLGRLGEEQPAAIVVVDNSPSGSLEGELVRLEPTLGYLPQDRNLGFAGGVNRGLRWADRSTVVLLNPDARPEPGCLSGLAAIVEREGDVIAGPALVSPNPEEAHPPSALRRDPSVLTALVEYTVLGRLAGKNWLDSNYFLRPEDVTASPVECATVQGACLAFPRQMIEGVGDFDERRFFFYWEETDFERRVRAAGGRVLYCPYLRCLHEGGASTTRGRQDADAFWRGFYRYHRKYGGTMTSVFLRCALIAGIGIETAVLAGIRVSRQKRDPRLEADYRALRARLTAQFIRTGGEGKSS